MRCGSPATLCVNFMALARSLWYPMHCVSMGAKDGLETLGFCAFVVSVD